MKKISDLFKTFRTTQRTLQFLAPFLVLTAFLASTTHVDFSGDMEGIYLLKTSGRFAFELQNDLFLGDERNVILRLDFEPIYEFVTGRKKQQHSLPALSYEWSKRNGRGFVINNLPDGKRLLTCLGRFRDSDGSVPKGLFVGGGLPVSLHEDIMVTMNETGMAYYNGSEWKHLWCSVNEAIASGTNPERMYPPSRWNYIDSKIIEKGKRKLVIRSRHQLEVDGVPLTIKRLMYFRAGEKYLVLAMSIKNVGNKTVSYHYVYGDEPWVGDFGTSAGNVGWVQDRICYYEGTVDPGKYAFAGMYDYGNRMIQESGHAFSGVANFIEWLGDKRPDLVYFSNRIGVFAQEREKKPLYSKDNRVLFVQWGPRSIRPREENLYLLAIGMADTVPGRHLPVKPPVNFTAEDYRRLDEP